VSVDHKFIGCNEEKGDNTNVVSAPLEEVIIAGGILHSQTCWALNLITSCISELQHGSSNELRFLNWKSVWSKV